MNFKSKTMALVAGLGMLHGASSALAAPGDLDLTTVCDINVYVSGASAQDNTLNAQTIALMVGSGTVPGTGVSGVPAVTNGTIFTGADDTSWRVIVGELDPTAITGGTGGVSGGTGVVGCVHKRSEGGSAWGVQPVAQGTGSGVAGRTTGTAVVMMNPIDCDSEAFTCDQTDVNESVLIVPDFGISDVEPAQFIGVNTPGPQVTASDNLGGGIEDPTLAGMSSADSAKLTVFQQAMFPFAVGINPEFYRALQVCQGIYPTFAAGAADADGYDDLALMPSLTKGQIVSMFAGELVDFRSIPCSNFDASFAEPTNLNLYSVADAAGVAPSDTGTHVCTRVNGSGTQAQFRIKQFGLGCLGTGAFDFRDPVLPGIVEFWERQENSGSSDMARCIGGTATGVTPRSTKWKIGFQSTEKVEDFTSPLQAAPAVGSGDRGFYRFIKVDNQAPTLENTANGGWYDAVQATLQLRNSREFFHAVEDGGVAQDVENIVQTLIDNFGTAPAVFEAPGTAAAGEVWYGGSLLVHDGGVSTCDINASEFDPVTNACATYTHAFGAGLNNCRTPTYTGPVELDSRPATP